MCWKHESVTGSSTVSTEAAVTWCLTTNFHQEVLSMF